MKVIAQTSIGTSVGAFFFCFVVVVTHSDVHKTLVQAFAVLPLSLSSLCTRSFQQQQQQQQQHCRTATSSLLANDADSNNGSNQPNTSSGGTFRPFIESAWTRLQQEESLQLEPIDLSDELTGNESPARGMPEGSTVRISVQAMKPATTKNDSTTTTSSPIQYARYALLETLTPTDSPNTAGIQVLNLVVFSHEIVWGVDLVSLPGNKHLLALDAQPMSTSTTLTEAWKEWHQQYVQDTFAWGGDIPEPAQKFFSPYTLWTRLNGEDAVGVIQGKVMEAFLAHQEIFLKTIQTSSSSSSSSSSTDGDDDDDDDGTAGTSASSVDNHQDEYLNYRRTNDPARPMLKSLYGPEWTERLIEEVLFPRELS